MLPREDSGSTQLLKQQTNSRGRHSNPGELGTKVNQAQRRPSFTDFSCCEFQPWPKCDFPAYRYPLEDFVKENQAEDMRCLAMAEDIISSSYKEGGVPVAGVITEPIQAEGGDNYASKEFFQVGSMFAGQ